MRGQMRAKVIKIVLWVIISAMAIVLVLPTFMDKASKAAWVLSINGNKVMYNDFAMNVAAQKERLDVMRQQYGPYADEFFKAFGMNPQQMAMQELIRNALLDQAVDTMSLNVSHEYVAQQLQNVYFIQEHLSDLLPLYVFDETGINQRALRNHLHRMGLSAQEFDALITQRAQRNFAGILAQGAHYIPEFAKKDFYATHYLGKKFSILSLDLETFLKEEQTKTVTQEQLQSFFDAQNKAKKRYWVPEKRDGITWTVTPEKYGITVSQDEIESYYKKHKVKKFVDAPTQIQVRRILVKVGSVEEQQAAYEKLKEVQQELTLDPSLFAQKAKEMSDDKDSAKNGGLLEYFARGDKEKVFEKAAFLLKNDGDVSDIIVTQDGFEIVQRVGRKKQTFKSLSAASKEIKATLTKRKFESTFAKDMRAFVNQANIDQKELASFMQKKGAQKNTLTKKEKLPVGIEAKLFDLKKGAATAYTSEGEGFVVLLTNITKKYLPELKTLEATVKSDLYRDRAQKQLYAQLDDMKKEASSKTLAQLKEQFGGSLEATKFLKDGDKDSLDSLSKKGLLPQEIMQLEKIGALKVVKTDEKGFLVRLDQLEKFDQAQYTQEKSAISSDLDRQTRGNVVDGFVASLRENATIKVNETILSLHEESVV